MLNLLKSELFKLRHSRGFHVLIVLSLVFGVFESISLAYGGMSGDSIRFGAYEAFYHQFSNLRTLVFIFAGAFSGIFIGEDFACRTYQAEIASGHSRFKVLLSKTMIYMLGICSMIFVQLFIVTTGTALVNGFGELVTVSVILNMVRAGLMFMFHICACSMFCVFTAINLKSKGSILAVNFLIITMIDGLFQLFSTMSNRVLDVYALTPFLQSLLSTLPAISGRELVKSSFIGITVILCLYSLTYITFRRCELK